jgi:Clostripain family
MEVAMTINAAQTPNWTVLVYMVADTGDSFYQDAMKDITEMMKAGFDDQVRVVVHAKAPSPWQTRCWKVTGAIKVEEGDAGDEIGVATEINSYSLDFVQKSVDKYESENYLLILWGHGEGIDWKEQVLANSPSGSKIIGSGKRFAPGSQGAIEVGEIGKSLAELRLEKVPKERVVVGFDACLMGMVEVFYEIHPYVGWAVAADDEIPDTGWPYTNILKLLGSHPDIQPKALAENIVRICAESYSDPDQNPESKVSFAACDLSESTAVFDAMKNLTNELSACIKERSVWDAVKNARDSAEDLREKAYVDLYAFCSNLKATTEGKEEFRQLSYAANEVMLALDSRFVSKFQFSDSYPYRYSKDAQAVSICFPESDELLGSIPGLRVNWGSYKDLTFCRPTGTGWPDFLEKFWGSEPIEAAPYTLKALGQTAG